SFNTATCSGSGCTGNGGATWAYPFAAPAAGDYTVRAQAINSAGTTTTANIVFTIDNTAPNAPTVTSPAAPVSVNTATFAVAGSTVELFRGGTISLGTTTADVGGNWSKTIAALPAATYSITARATDAVGNTSAASAALSITIDTTAPTVAIGAPSSSATRSGPVTYTVTYGSANFVTLASGDITLNTTGTAAATVAVSGT